MLTPRLYETEEIGDRRDLVGNSPNESRWLSESLRGRTLDFAVYLLGAWGDLDPKLAKIFTDAKIPFTAGPEASRSSHSFGGVNDLRTD